MWGLVGPGGVDVPSAIIQSLPEDVQKWLVVALLSLIVYMAVLIWKLLKKMISDFVLHIEKSTAAIAKLQYDVTEAKTDMLVMKTTFNERSIKFDRLEMKLDTLLRER